MTNATVTQMQQLQAAITGQKPDLEHMTKEQLMQLVLNMQSQPAKKITLKVSEKGGLSLYGLGRFPVTLYRSQWERLLTADTVKQVQDFIKANSALLTVKA